MRVEHWNGNAIRFIDYNSEWWAVAKDVADALSYRDAEKATQRLAAKYKGTAKVGTLGGEQRMTILNEKGCYRLIMRSNKPEAEAFQDWIYEIIKHLRETSGLEGYQIFKALDREHQSKAMARLKEGLEHADDVSYLKANSIANKAVSLMFGLPKSISKKDMTPEMLKARELIIDDTVDLMRMNERLKLGISISKAVYSKYTSQGVA
ncbi:BRO-N domain-containing protein [Lacticaseibacillus saniviri]